MLCAQTFAIQELIINSNITFYYNLNLNQTKYQHINYKMCNNHLNTLTAAFSSVVNSSIVFAMIWTSINRMLFQLFSMLTTFQY